MSEETLPTTEDLGGYQAERELGHGTTGAVYLAASPDGEWVAVKRIPGAAPTDEMGVDLLRRQTERLVGIEHPHLVRIRDVLIADADLCVVMEYVHGPNLRDVLAYQTPLRDQVACWVTDLGDALDYLHRLGIVHRDVKPSNVIVDQAGDVKLTDYVTFDLPGQHPVHGTPAYVSPEIARGDRAVDGRADVYSLACLAYEALAGLPPFPVDQEHPENAIRAHIRVAPPDPSQVLPQFPVTTARALLAGLEKDPAARPASAGRFAAALAATLTGDVEAAQPEETPATAAVASRRPTAPREPRKDDPDRTMVAPLSSPLRPTSLSPPPPPTIKLGGTPTWVLVVAILLGVVGVVVAGLGIAIHFAWLHVPKSFHLPF